MMIEDIFCRDLRLISRFIKRSQEPIVINEELCRTSTNHVSMDWSIIILKIRELFRFHDVKTDIEIHQTILAFLLKSIFL